ncbi:MAG TPA: hypothetical protein V6D11_25585 [Waterburya sp.]|jgi:hypothetical protein
MKCQPFYLLTVCIAISGGLLIPSKAALSHSVERQGNREQAQHLVCTKEGEHFLCNVEKRGERDRESANQNAVKKIQSSDKLKSSTVNVAPQLLSSEQQRVIVNILLGIGFLIPCGALLGICLYDKYCAYRSAVLKEQIELLERLWKQTSQH